MNSDSISSSILLVGTATGLFNSMCPPIFHVSTPVFHAHDTRNGNIRNIRACELSASLMVIAMGAGLSHAQNSALPFWTAVGLSALFVFGYEYMMSHPVGNQ